MAKWSAKARSRGYTMGLTDHRGRVFDVRFFVAGSAHAPGLFV